MRLSFLKTNHLLAIGAAAAFLLAVTANASAQSSTSTAVSGSNAASLSGSQAINSWSSTSNYKNRNNTPGVAIGGGSPSPRTCAANLGAGIGVPGFGLGLNVPVEMRGCAVERSFHMVRQIPGMKRAKKSEVMTQVACQDKYAGAALSATGTTCLVGRYKNRQEVAVRNVNYVRQQSGLYDNKRGKSKRAQPQQVSAKVMSNREKMRKHCLAAGVRDPKDC